MHKKIPSIFTFISTFNKQEIFNLDKKVALILRNNNKKIDKNKILEIKRFCKKNNKLIYLANDIKQAINFGFDGVYISAFNKEFNCKKYSKKKDFIILGSAHNTMEVKIKEKQGVELIFLSPLFKTKDYKKNLGIIKFNFLSSQCKTKVIALGGIRKRNINKLKMVNAYGFSAITYFNEDI